MVLVVLEVIICLGGLIVPPGDILMAAIDTLSVILYW